MRAIGISLLIHALLLLQPGFGAHRYASARWLQAKLRPTAASRSVLDEIHRETSTRIDSPPVAPTASTTVRPVAEASRHTEPPTAAATPVPGKPGRANNTDRIVTTETDADADANISTETEAEFGESKKSYLFAIAREAGRGKNYPRASSERVEGRVEIRITVAATGDIRTTQLNKSSGDANLDSAALELVDSALKRTPVPDNLRGRAFEFIVPVSFAMNPT